MIAFKNLLKPEFFTKFVLFFGLVAGGCATKTGSSANPMASNDGTGSSGPSPIVRQVTIKAADPGQWSFPQGTETIYVPFVLHNDTEMWLTEVSIKTGSPEMPSPMACNQMKLTNVMPNLKITGILICSNPTLSHAGPITYLIPLAADSKPTQSIQTAFASITILGK